MKLSSIFTRLLLVLSVAFIYTGCATQMNKKNSIVHVSASSFNNISVHGDVVRLSELGKKLKSVGAGKTSQITVALEKYASEQLMIDITRELGKAGFRRVVFTKPRKVKTTVSE